LLSHNPEVARALLEGLDSRHALTTDSLRQLAAAYEGTGDLAKARAVYERSAQGAPPSLTTLLALARVAWKQKDYEGVLGYLGHARDLDPKNAAIPFFFGITCNEMRLPAEAKKSLEQAVALDPSNPVYNYALGTVLLNYSDKSLAIPYLKEFVEARPDDPRGHLALATAYLGAYQFDEAKAELKKPLNSPQTRSNAEYLLGRIAAQQDDVPTAIAHFKTLVATEPKWPEAHAELGSALLEKEDVDGARHETEAALALDPENYLANRTLLRLYQLAGDPRVKEQTERIQKIIENRDERLKLMQRSIEVRPY
jgi:tetratricopeptide (TPR) repeat protein